MRKSKTLIAIPSPQEWKILYPKVPYSKTVEEPYVQNALFDVACVGIGIVNFVGNLTKLICTKSYSRVIIAGIAGALPFSGLQTADIVRVDEECTGDIGYWNKDEFQSYFPKPQIVKATPKKFAPKEIASLPGVRGMSVNTMTSSKQVLEYRAKFYGAKIEAMEGVAAFMLAQTLGIQIFEIRTVSNLTGDLDETRWNIEQSLLNLQSSVLNPIIEAVK